MASAIQNIVGVDQPDGVLTFEEACLKCEGMTMVELGEPTVSNKEPGVLKMAQLPLRDDSGCTKLKYTVEMLLGWTQPPLKHPVAVNNADIVDELALASVLLSFCLFD